MFGPNLHQLKSRQTRQRLLEAAVELLARRGEEGLSLQEVARQAGMTTGAVQHHFASKAALRSEVMSRLVQSLGEADGVRPEAGWPLERRAAHFVREAWKQVFGHPRFCAAWAAFLAGRAHPVARAHVVQRLAPIMGRVNEQLVESLPELATRPGGAARAQLALATLRGLGLAAPFSPPGSVDASLDLLIDDLVSACREPVPADVAVAPKRSGKARKAPEPRPAAGRSRSASARARSR